MPISQLSQLAAVGTFDGATLEQLTPSRGFGAITRAINSPAGVWDVVFDNAIAGPLNLAECQILLSCEGVGSVRNFAEFRIVDASTIRVQNYSPDAGDVADCVFSMVIHRIN